MYILAEGSQRTRGGAAQDMNVRAGKAVANAVRTTLGPRGMDKMLVDSSGTVVITNDGATILGEMDIDHPAARMVVEVAESQEETVGDGTTTAAVLTGELLAHAEDLLGADVHPSVVIEGYTEAARLAGEAIDDQLLAVAVDDEILRQVAESSMTGKGTGDVAADRLADLVVRAVRQVHGEQTGAEAAFDRDDVRVHTLTGASSSATTLLEGVVLEKSPVNDNMPRSVEDATVALLDIELDVRTGDVGAEYALTSVDQLDAAIAAEDAERRSYAKQLADAGVDVVVSTKKIEDRVADHLASSGILAFKNVSDADARSLARTTGATRLGSLTDLEEADLGYAEEIRVDRYGDEDLVVVEGGAESAAVTLLARGGTEHVVDELERALDDAVDVVVTALDRGGVVPGAGATEVAIADHLRSHAAGIEGRKQLAVEAFADAVETLPRTLAESAGMDPIDAVVDLRARFEREGSAGVIAHGRTGTIGDPVEYGIIDPAAVKHEAVRAATEAATMLLRIDDVIAAQ
jgi:thermosome